MWAFWGALAIAMVTLAREGGLEDMRGVFPLSPHGTFASWHYVSRFRCDCQASWIWLAHKCVTQEAYFVRKRGPEVFMLLNRQTNSIVCISTLQVRYFQARQQEIHDTKQPFTKDQPTCKHNDWSFASALPASPPQTEQTANRTCQRERRRIVHACEYVSKVKM